MKNRVSTVALILKMKTQRLISFMLFRKRSALRNHFGSYISPLETSVANDLSAFQRLKPLMDKLKSELVDFPLTRIGSANDGGYVLLDKEYHGSFLISGGIFNDNNFEVALADLGAKGHQIDFSISSPPKQHSNLTFSPQRLVGDELKEFSYDISLDEIVKEKIDQTSENYSELLLKLDIEGSEWEVLEKSTSLTRFSQIYLELHYLERLAHPNFSESSINTLERILDLFFPVFISGNNCCGFVNIGGYAIPRVMEMTLLNRSLYSFTPSQNSNLNSLYQSQNYPKRAPLVLKKW